MLVKVYGGSVFGISATTVTVEVNIDKGVGYFLVGLPDNAVKESCHRIHAALVNLGCSFPGRKITINMAPADMRKEGSAYDLPLAIGILAASGQLPQDALSDYLIMGELSLDGGLQPIKGALPLAIQAREEGFKGFILPAQNAREAAIVDDLAIYGLENLSQALDFFKGGKKPAPLVVDTRKTFYEQRNQDEPDFADVRGQENVKRCMEIAAAGGHNLLLVGPPGAGKTMLAKRLASILPPMSLQEALETTEIHSVCGRLKEDSGLMATRPFRAPHHSISDAALVGGGSYPQPGEISLAHNGVLFLDELPEFKRGVLEAMRQPLEDREVTISRAKFTLTYPASFTLVAAMNPSPSGYFEEATSSRNGLRSAARRYQNSLSGPLLDRIDMHIEVNPVAFEALSQTRRGEPSAAIRKRVSAARECQAQRFKDRKNLHCNAQMQRSQTEQFCPIDRAGRALLKDAMQRLSLSARAYDRILKMARTIADLEARENICEAQLSEALQYRHLDREGWWG